MNLRALFDVVWRNLNGPKQYCRRLSILEKKSGTKIIMVVERVEGKLNSSWGITVGVRECGKVLGRKG